MVIKMKNIIIIITTLIGLNTFAEAPASEWEIKDLGTLSDYSEAYISDFNDLGQTLIVAKKLNNKKEEYTWLLASSSSNLKIITDPTPGYWAPIWWHRVNGKGVVAGTREANTGTLNNNLFLTTWDTHSGAKSYRLPLTKEHPSSGFIAKCKMSDQIIISTFTDPKLGGSRDGKVFSLINGSIKELTPKLKQLASEHGYETGDWVIASVNSQGMMLGRFDYYETHPQRPQVTVPAGSIYFLLNNEHMSLIEFPAELLNFYGRNKHFLDLSHAFLDESGQVMFDSFVSSSRTWENWIWDPNNGLKFLDQEESVGIRGGHAKARALCLMDNGSILWMVQGCEDCNGYYIQSATELLRLPLDKGRQPFQEDLDQFQNLQVIYSLLFKTWTLNTGFSNSLTSANTGEFIANSKGQIFFIGSFYDEKHPFLIEPKLNEN